ncbi:hypothetical protein ATHSA_0021 [Athalassotoga saccharophila]|nr:hypothetical protein ATHSA_0021 [Athalassotoga saccharophila]
MKLVERWKMRCPIIKFIERRRMKKTKLIIKK